MTQACKPQLKTDPGTCQGAADRTTDCSWSRSARSRIEIGTVVFSLLLCQTGCTTTRMPNSFSSLIPGRSVTTGQWEPDVDYEAEQAKMEAENKTAEKTE